MTAEPEWIEADEALRLQEQVAAAFGGVSGLGDRWALEFALGRPPNLFAHGQEDLFELAAAYALGIVRRRPFVAGNLRAAFAFAGVFLGLNGLASHPPEEEVVVMVEGLAAGDVAQESFAAWLRKHARR